MKRYVYVFCLFVSLLGLISCSKNNDTPAPVVVGTWKLDRVRLSGFVAPYTSYNGDNDPLTVFGIQDSYTINNDNGKTYTETIRNNGIVSDYNGTWDYTNTTLTLKDTQGNTDIYTVDNTKTPLQMLGNVVATSDSLLNPTTKKGELVKFNVQTIYIKQ